MVDQGRPVPGGDAVVGGACRHAELFQGCFEVGSTRLEVGPKMFLKAASQAGSQPTTARSTIGRLKEQAMPCGTP